MTCLYELCTNAKHSNYFSEMLRNEALKEIVKKTGRIVEECKKIMSSSLAAKRMEKSKMKKGTETGKRGVEMADLLCNLIINVYFLTMTMNINVRDCCDWFTGHHRQQNNYNLQSRADSD